ncbi:hypothetical protein QZH41_012241 [Actinostola sp. cb2023]|nr:hypothetical protein QZH41_012241 [Actinostola sp. cb2023]
MAAFSKLMSVVTVNPSKWLTPKVSIGLVSAAAGGLFLMWRKQLKDHEERKKTMDARDLHISLEQAGNENYKNPSTRMADTRGEILVSGCYVINY